MQWEMDLISNTVTQQFIAVSSIGSSHSDMTWLDILRIFKFVDNTLVIFHNDFLLRISVTFKKNEILVLCGVWHGGAGVSQSPFHFSH